jgi:hypothetical protein
MVDVNRKNNLIGFQDKTTIVVKIENYSDLKQIKKNVSNINEHKRGLSSIVETKLFEPQIDVEQNNLLKVKLINFHDFDLNVSVQRAFDKKCKELNLDVEKMKYTSDLTVYKIKYNEESFPKLQEFDAISSIEDMPVFDVSFDSEVEQEAIDFEPIIPEEGKSYPTVGILDSGINRNPPLNPWLIEENFSPYIESELDKGHGSAVASVLIYGDYLEEKSFTDLEGCYIYDATIVPKKSLLGNVDEFDLINNIKEAIKGKRDIKIWNLCVGWDQEVSPDKISDFGAALDFFQDEFNVIICTSVGNCDNFLINKKRGKIQASSDSVRAISVGSIAHVKNQFDLSEIDETSPFSRVGHGPFDLIKPELVHYGGNAGLDTGGKGVFSGTRVIDLNGNMATKIGTSFSTPRITSIVAALENELLEDFDPILLKALIIHSAKHSNTQIDQEDRLKQMGFGLPSSMKEILYNAENEITLVIRDKIEKGHFIEILDFPYPSSMVEGDFYTGEITVTLVSAPDLDLTQGEEYCQSNIDVYFGTYNDKVQREGNTIKNPIGKGPDAKNLLQPSVYSKRAMKDNTHFNGERLLKKFHKKYQVVKKWVINLSELTDANKKRHTEYPKRWFLKIEGLFRDHIEKTKDNVECEFCLIITIRDNKHGTQVYHDVTNSLEEHNFIQNDIQVRTNIELRS